MRLWVVAPLNLCPTKEGLWNVPSDELQLVIEYKHFQKQNQTENDEFVLSA